MSHPDTWFISARSTIWTSVLLLPKPTFSPEVHNILAYHLIYLYLSWVFIIIVEVIVTIFRTWWNGLLKTQKTRLYWGQFLQGSRWLELSISFLLGISPPICHSLCYSLPHSPWQASFMDDSHMAPQGIKGCTSCFADWCVPGNGILRNSFEWKLSSVCRENTCITGAPSSLDWCWLDHKSLEANWIWCGKIHHDPHLVNLSHTSETPPTRCFRSTWHQCGA